MYKTVRSFADQPTVTALVLQLLELVTFHVALTRQYEMFGYSTLNRDTALQMAGRAANSRTPQTTLNATSGAATCGL
jgi:hypothetical protein